MRLLHVFAFSKEITLVDSNQGNLFENATACSKRMRKTLVATQLKLYLVFLESFLNLEEQFSVDQYYEIKQ